MEDEKGTEGVGEEEHGHRYDPWHLPQALSTNQQLVHVKQRGTEQAEQYGQHRQRSNDFLHRISKCILHFHTNTHFVAGHIYKAACHLKRKGRFSLAHDGASRKG